MNYIHKGAQFSSCDTYRYGLWRAWGDQPIQTKCVMFIGLNPSTADASEDDNTIRRCVGFADSWGFNMLMMTNLFAFAATDPEDMKGVFDPVGPDNDRMLLHYARRADLIVAAWGNDGNHKGRDIEVRKLLPTLYHLRLTKAGQPGHPLYLPKTLTPQRWMFT